VLDPVRLTGDERPGAGEPPVRHVRVVVHEVVHAPQKDGADRGADGMLLGEGVEALQQRLGGQVGLVEHRPADPDHQLPLAEVDLGALFGQGERAGQVTPGEGGVEFRPRRAAEVSGHGAILPHLAVTRKSPYRIGRNHGWQQDPLRRHSTPLGPPIHSAVPPTGGRTP
jgi:hypothetical protein